MIPNSVIPGWSEGPYPESRDSGLDAFASPRNDFVVPRHPDEDGKAGQMKRRRGLNRGALHRDDRFADDQVCWIAESSQLAPRGRAKVHTSVTSSGSPPETSRPVVRSKVLSTSAYRIATLA